MATARKRWFRVADAILRKSWTNDELAALVRLMAYLNGRWAREGIPSEDAGHHAISLTDAMTITGKRRPDAAIRMLERLATITSMSVEHRTDIRQTSRECSTDVCLISWPKYPVFQGMTSPKMPPPRHATRDTRPAYKSRGSANPSKARPPASPPCSEGSLRLASLLSELLQNVPGARIPRGARRRWGREIDRLIREAPELREAEDPYPHLEAAVRWALGPDNLGQPYEVVIRSGSSLREKWPKLVAAARRKEASRSRTVDERVRDIMNANQPRWEDKA